MSRDDRYEHGLEILRQIDGEAGQKVIDSLADVSPQLGREVISWAFGDTYARPGLPPRDRQLVTLGALTALGGCLPAPSARWAGTTASTPSASPARTAGFDPHLGALTAGPALAQGPP